MLIFLKLAPGSSPFPEIIYLHIQESKKNKKTSETDQPTVIKF